MIQRLNCHIVTRLPGCLFRARSLDLPVFYTGVARALLAPEGRSGAGPALLRLRAPMRFRFRFRHTRSLYPRERFAPILRRRSPRVPPLAISGRKHCFRKIVVPKSPKMARPQDAPSSQSPRLPGTGTGTRLRSELRRDKRERGRERERADPVPQPLVPDPWPGGGRLPHPGDRHPHDAAALRPVEDPHLRLGAALAALEHPHPGAGRQRQAAR